ncbi:MULTISPECIES: cobalamin-independent methionine synthase II family protein [Aerococcus]|uniref:Cobalamin-independent methionine synthase II family protein n=1 Tax=Aerococcus tenax TaxID=3078812 RepID=A0A5N1BKE1_9LACT|nr:cobalamin-independent methionine synthase II family protein [Aerococcus urinae]KAA9239444.1 cobalamin-independent methionine synthase II family protein [Aerococcus urinae]MDK6370540.1 cobalamin-independent methionine synthase II family protein [Aerococcus urinae]MDK6596788.1 cobalamin-independent methionine synthase II family protein [Aerococcus urinae]MDK7302252.1 cobalamin-independent methionine synthase II family protein [Aerococcus urinae]MDK7800797.1 cobalamin-independent methionine sy
MTNKILTTHVGSLPRTQALLEANKRRTAGTIAEDEFNQIIAESVDQVVKKQKEIGIDQVNDGEYGHVTSGAVDYGAWWNYSFYRLGGLEMTDEDRWAKSEAIRSTPGNIKLTNFPDRRDRQKFRAAYEDPDSGVLGRRNKVANPVFADKVIYIGQDQVNRDVKLLTQALEKYDIKQGFMAAISPGAAARLEDRYYHDEEALLNDVADALHEEYKAITDAGLIVQLDAPDLAEAWDQINPEPSLKDFQAWLQKRVDAANRALEGIDPSLVRLHICWGSWHGPHTTDIPFEDIVDQCLQIKAGSFSFEASSPRHGHEWRVWEKIDRLKAGQKIVPGFVSHSTNAVEHPQLIADRIERFAKLVGPENVIASTDCGLGGRLHEQIAWAKLEALVEGAAIASKRLFG